MLKVVLAGYRIPLLVRIWGLMDVTSALQRIGAVANALLPEDAAALPRLVEGCKTFLKALACKLLFENPTRPAMLQYSCDTTPVKLSKRSKFQVGTYVAAGRAPQTHEFFVQQIYLSVSNGLNQLEHAIVVKEPMVLEHGKTMPALLACSFTSPGILLGCDPRQGITLHHQVHDRGVSGKFVSALAHHWQRAVQDAAPPVSEQNEPQLNSGLLHWYSHCGCSLHDTHNALRWAYETLFGKEAALQKALFAAMASYRQCLLSTFACLGSWLVEVVEVIPDHQAANEEHLLQVYSLLGHQRRCWTTWSAEFAFVGIRTGIVCKCLPASCCSTTRWRSCQGC